MRLAIDAGAPTLVYGLGVRRSFALENRRRHLLPDAALALGLCALGQAETWVPFNTSLGHGSAPVAAVLAFAGFGQGLHGLLLWPALAFQVAMGVWCITVLSRNDDVSASGPARAS